MPAQLIDGKATAATLREDVKTRAEALTAQMQSTPKLVVILVGEDPASTVYVRNKEKACVEAGIAAETIRLAASTTEADLLARIRALNEDDATHGILVQMPLPAHMREQAVIQTIAPEKDVDGFHEINAGRLQVGAGDGLVPCTPKGCIKLISQALGRDLSGKHAVVIGRSNIVGKPVAQLLLQQSCTVSICHSKTQDIANLVRQADIVVAAVGRPELVKKDWIKPGACVIDVGINRTEKDGKTKLIGDVAFDEVREVAGHITPVPGGVGPMTIACLLENTLDAFELQHAMQREGGF